MTPKNRHTRILLAKNERATIAFCAACDVVELEIGALSLRIEAQTLQSLSHLLKEADTRLSYYRLEKAGDEKSQMSDLNFH